MPKNSSNRYAVAMKNEGSQNIYLKTCRGCVRCFCDGEVHSRKCERRARACGIAQSIIRIVIIRCRKNSLQKIFCEINFRSLMRLRKFFNNENFPIYGIMHTHICTHYNVHTHIPADPMYTTAGLRR